MKLYGKKVGSYWELAEYQKGTKKFIITHENLCTRGDGILLFDRGLRLSCVLEVVRVRKSSESCGIYYVETKVLNPEVQEISLPYFGYTRLNGLQFIGYSSLCSKLNLKPKK